MGNVLEVRDLRMEIRLRSATVHAVDGISFNVGVGETVGIVGESGCGKTMTGMSIMRLLPNGGSVAGGQILLEGRDLAAMSDADIRRVRGNEIGMVFQDPMTSLNPTMTIGRQIAEAVRLHRGVSESVAMQRAAEVLDLVGMPFPKERLKDYAHQLSGGLRQRVMIAMALSCSPKLLIADEPTTALDVTIQAQILGLLDRLKAELNMAMILITHDMGVTAGRADRVVVMYAGKIVESAATGELFGNVRHPYTEALLASIPQLDQDRSQKLYSIPGLPPDLTRPPAGCRFAARCAFASDVCVLEEPPLGGSNPNHLFACFHPRQTSVEELAGSAASLIEQADSNQALRSRYAKELELLGQAAQPGVARQADGSGDSTGPPARNESFVLEFRNVSKEFVVTAGSILRRKVGSLKAVSDVSFGVRPGETFGLVGESGCGKTTLGRMGVASEIPTSGHVIFDGKDLAAMRARELRTRRRDLQLMFQDPYSSLDPRMRVKEIIREPLDVAHWKSPVERDDIVATLLDEVGLPRASMNRYPHEFSGGQRQRLGLARALTLNPKLIVADEPVSALDVSVRSQILNLMKRLQATHGLTYVVISHDLSVVKYLADRIGVMYLGKLVEVGTGEDIYERSAHPYTAGLLQSIPVPRPEIARERAGRVAMSGEIPSAVNPPSGCRFRTRCPRAQEICALEAPPMSGFGGEHQAACHFPLQSRVLLPGADVEVAS
jgi:oligopeptide/dipeptide ABC transporter ATP-binding protein